MKSGLLNKYNGARIMILLLLLAAALIPPAAAAAPDLDDSRPQADILLLAQQRKQYDRGNCYQWKLCRGDSIGNAWVGDPCFCSIQGGRSWMDTRGKCHDLIDGPFGTECR